MSSSSIKAISLWQPWASLVAWKLKRMETRSWGTNYRGALVICAARKNTQDQRQLYEYFCHHYEWRETWDDLPFGKTVALCELTNCLTMDTELIEQQSEQERQFGDWKVGRVAWELTKVRALEPIIVVGRQRLFEVEPRQIVFPKPIQLELNFSQC